MIEKAYVEFVKAWTLLRETGGSREIAEMVDRGINTRRDRIYELFRYI